LRFALRAYPKSTSPPGLYAPKAVYDIGIGMGIIGLFRSTTIQVAPPIVIARVSTVKAMLSASQLSFGEKLRCRKHRR
jgi:hypothetical protein